ncbi:MAM and LDL-receptor class A domain-containing protein 1-like [Anneissia japonica]|uniref:MAM and LDL-receptor class A domain-containing protein 1-like n=1 Tax=Anneissia japonica TaxID=1529436 RepID=UPI00142560E4|nr:MAM and LDL-receptor class A domain-containing protein 1-like [Anneissia japonica]
MYISGYGKEPGQVARLKTPAFSSKYTSYCISFSYYMIGPYVGQLEVIIEEKVRGVGQPIRNLSGIQGLYWNIGYIQFQPTDSFKVIFQAIVGSNPSTSYIGLDDLEIQNGTCPLTPMPTQPPPIFKECTFESNPVLCGFTSLERNRWSNTRATSSSLPNDHTLNSANGHYIYSSSDKSVLYSPFSRHQVLKLVFLSGISLPPENKEKFGYIFNLYTDTSESR